MKNGYLVKIIPPEGYSIHKFEFARWQVIALAAALVLVVGSLGAFYAARMHWAAENVRQMRAATDSQAQQLNRIDRQAQALGSELQRIQRQNQQIRRLMGADKPGGARGEAAPARPQQQSMQPVAAGAVAQRLARLEAASQRARGDQDRLRRLAMHVLNVRHIEELARAEMIAAIPSINPVPGTSIASAYGWRSDPWPSYHKGVDLDANYGDQVLAAAAGTVASAGWDGGYGIKVDVDHHNGYHTWYAHLSRVGVSVGDYVRKAQPIAWVGATGDATGPHLHYQVMYLGQTVDPAPFLNGVPARVLASLH